MEEVGRRSTRCPPPFLLKKLVIATSALAHLVGSLDLAFARITLLIEGYTMKEVRVNVKIVKTAAPHCRPNR